MFAATDDAHPRPHSPGLRPHRRTDRSGGGARGVDAQRLLADTGIEASWLGDAEARMPLAVEERLWNRAYELTGDPLFGLHAAAAIRPGAFDMLDRPVPAADPALSRIVTAHAEQLLAAHEPFHEGTAAQGRRPLAEGKANGPTTLEEIAQRLH